MRTQTIGGCKLPDLNETAEQDRGEPMYISYDTFCFLSSEKQNNIVFTL